MILTYVLAAIFVFLAVLLLLGKGDMLIAGYNTASPEEREQYDIRRLRLLVALVLIIVSVGMVLMALWPERLATHGLRKRTDSCVIEFCAAVFCNRLIVILLRGWCDRLYRRVDGAFWEDCS